MDWPKSQEAILADITLVAAGERCDFRRLRGGERFQRTLPRGQAALASQYCSIRRRSAASGTRPRPAPWLSSRWLILVEPGIAQVTAGCEMTYLRKNCAQLVTSMSAAQGGRARSAACLKSEARPKGRFTSTAIL